MIRVCVACEGKDDFLIATVLADRMLLSSVPWIEGDAVSDFREFRGEDNTELFLKLSSVPSRAQSRGFGMRPHGHFQGVSGAVDALLARKALMLLLLHDDPPDVVIMLRDQDGESERIAGLHQAREEREWPFAIVLGVPVPMVESWALAALDAVPDHDRELLSQVRQKIGFDPVINASRLASSPRRRLPTPKKCMEFLRSTVQQIAEHGLTVCPLETLARRGEHSGLVAYLDELRQRYLPLFAPTKR